MASRLRGSWGSVADEWPSISVAVLSPQRVELSWVQKGSFGSPPEKRAAPRGGARQLAPGDLPSRPARPPRGRWPSSGGAPRRGPAVPAQAALVMNRFLVVHVGAMVQESV